MSRMPGTIALFLKRKENPPAGPGQESMKARGEGSERHPDESTTPGLQAAAQTNFPQDRGPGTRPVLRDEPALAARA